MRIWNVNICFDHGGGHLEVKDIYMDDYVIYDGILPEFRLGEPGENSIRYYFHFARYKGNIYCRCCDIIFTPRHFFKLKDMKIQMSDDLYEVYESLLAKYKSYLLDNKLNEVLI